MARADYFDRAVQAAFHVLGNFDQESFLNKIDKHRVAVAFDCTVENAEGDAAIDLTIRLLARFYPKIAIIPLDAAAQAIAPKFKQLARAINPKIAIVERAIGVRDIIVVGKTSAPVIRGTTPIYIGSDGWIAKLSREKPMGSMSSNNPFGAGIAACLAAANVFRHVFTTAPLDDFINVSVLDLDPQAAEPLNPKIGSIDLGQVFLVGAGAIGNGFLWAISRCPNLKGVLNVIDHDHIDLFNIQRYVMTKLQDKGVSKVHMTARLLEAHPGILVNPVPKKWEEYISSLPAGDWLFERVVSALDTPDDRIHLQAALPKWIVNAWTGTGDAGVSQHDFLNHACMACLYMPTSAALNEDQLIALALGLPQDPDMLLEIRKKIETAWPIDKTFLERVASSKAVQIEKLLPFEGQTLRSLYSRGVCSGAVMELANGPLTERAEVPMPFQSALAGILEASWLVNHASGFIHMPMMSRINLMNRFPTKPGFSSNLKKNARCFCKDIDFKEIYLEKYKLQEADNRLC